MVGIDGSFTRAVLDTTADASLRAQPDFRAAVDSAGGFSNTGLLYLDVQTAMAVADAFDAGEGSEQGDEEMLRTVKSVAAVSRLDGTVVVTRIVISTDE
mgnify:CR=1 FL=1